MGEYYFEDLPVGFKYRSPYGRTITDVDNIWFTLLTNNVNPIHFDKVYVERNYGGEPFYGNLVVNGLLTLAIVTGLTTELSARGFMVGLENVRWLKPVFSGDTLTAECDVVEARPSKSMPGFGLVKLRTKGYNQRGEVVVEFDRVIIVPRRTRG